MSVSLPGMVKPRQGDSAYAAYGALATYEVGDSIDVIYDPNDPENAQVDIFAGRWLTPLLSSLPF